MTDFKNTRAALVVFDAGADERDRAWADADTDEAVAAAHALDKNALKKVQLAFYEDTKQFNSENQCLAVDLGHMRACAEKEN